MPSSRLLCCAAAFGALAFVTGCRPAPPVAEVPAPLNPALRPAIPPDTQTLSRDPKSDAAIKAVLASSAKRAAQKEAEGVMRASEYEALMRIATYTQNTRKMTDADVDFVTFLLRCGPLRVGESNKNSFRIWTMTALVGATKTTPAQKVKIVAALAPICEDLPEELRQPIMTTEGEIQSANVSVQCYAVGVLRNCDTPKAREICARLAKSSATARVRKDAESNLQRWAQQKRPEEAGTKAKGV